MAWLYVSKSPRRFSVDKDLQCSQSNSIADHKSIKKTVLAKIFENFGPLSFYKALHTQKYPKSPQFILKRKKLSPVFQNAIFCKLYHPFTKTTLD